jgi:E-phenylitaconyl-CoA hydratase
MVLARDLLGGKRAKGLIMSIDFDLLDGGIALITINRPERMNALDAQHYQAPVARLVHACATTTQIRVAIVTGAGEQVLQRRRRPQVLGRTAPPLAELWLTQKGPAAQPRPGESGSR